MTARKKPARKRKPAGKKPASKKSADKQAVVVVQPANGSKYRPEYADIARRLCEVGAIDVEIARVLGVHKSTFYHWAKEYPEFRDAIAVGKEPADRRALAAFYRKVCGWEEEQEVVHYDAQRGEFVRTTVVKSIPPDTASLIFWLKNRLGWRDKVEHNHGGVDGGPIQFSNIERARRLAFILKRATEESKASANEPA